MSVKRCQQEVDRCEFLEWIAVYEQEPWGSAREDVRMATLATLLANILSLIARLGGGKGQRSYTLHDFLPASLRRHQEQSPQQARAIFQAFVTSSQSGKAVANGARW